MFIGYEVIVMLKYIMYLWIICVLKLVIKFFRVRKFKGFIDVWVGEDCGVVLGVVIRC